MMRRGQCRCGTILHFQKTSQGYKKRCPDCGAVVRLRRSSSPALATQGNPPPLPGVAGTDCSADVLPPAPALPHLTPGSVPNTPALSDPELEAPQAFAELPVFTEPVGRSSGSVLPWIMFSLLAVAVVVVIVTATLLWG